MSASVEVHPWTAWHERLKFTVYALLAFNTLLFFLDEWEASEYLFSGEVPLAEVIVTFAASIDTLAWVLLLAMFELETYQIPDDRLTPPVFHTLRLMRGLCYFFVVYAFYGYLSKAIGLSAYDLEALPDLCAGIPDGMAVLLDLDEFETLTTGNCAELVASGDLRVAASGLVVAEPDTWRATVRLAWTDVINSGTWILVVALLELDVRLQFEHRLIGYWRSFSRWSKYVLYPTLLGAALYWGLVGVFLDFWDAFLWLVAFVFIELNVFQWRDERESAEHSESEAGSF
ncbi:MAG: hypothetical protein R3E82_10165 [Pseudomonadales bacterium]|nr:hypothetical protein [Pseudomonadales bacterium]